MFGFLLLSNKRMGIKPVPEQQPLPRPPYTSVASSYRLERETGFPEENLSSV